MTKMENADLKIELVKKLENEFELSNQSVLLSEIKRVLVDTEWDHETLEILLAQENVLHDMLIAIKNNKEMNDLFNGKIQELL